MIYCAMPPNTPPDELGAAHPLPGLSSMVRLCHSQLFRLWCCFIASPFPSYTKGAIVIVPSRCCMFKRHSGQKGLVLWMPLEEGKHSGTEEGMVVLGLRAGGSPKGTEGSHGYLRVLWTSSALASSPSFTQHFSNIHGQAVHLSAPLCVYIYAYKFSRSGHPPSDWILLRTS